MTETIIHVAQDAIRRNAKLGTTEPAIIVRKGSKSQRFQEVEILGPSKLVSSPNKPLRCGARVWITTNSEVLTR